MKQTVKQTEDERSEQLAIEQAKPLEIEVRRLEKVECTVQRAQDFY